MTAGVRQDVVSARAARVNVPGPALPFLAGNGLWRVRCLMCGEASPTPRTSILAAYEWHEWHAPLTGCLEHGVPPRPLPRRAVARRYRGAVVAA